MYDPANNDEEVWRIILVRRHATEFLALKNENGWALPRLAIPRRARVAQALCDRLKRVWNFDAFALCPLSLRTSCSLSPRVHAVEIAQHDPVTPEGAEWISLSTAEQFRFIESDDLTTLRALRHDFTASGEFIGSPGTLPRIRTWVDQALEPVGLKLKTQFRQLTAGKHFSLTRFETDGGGVWFKAVGEPNLHELPISRELAATLPAFVPRILAVREDWNAWLSLEVEGRHPDESSSLHSWIEVAATLADLQIASIGKNFLFIDAGCRDVRVPALVDAVRPFLEVAAELMDGQTTDNPPRMNQHELKTLENVLFESLTDLGDLHLPDTLGHLDFNPGNILVNGSDVVFLDWSAACVGCPFLTTEYLLERLRRLQPFLQTWRNEVLSAYLERYRFLVRPQELAAGLATTPLLAVFAYALAGGAWKNPARRHDPPTAAHLRSLTRRMNAEAALWFRSSGSRSLMRREA